MYNIPFLPFLSYKFIRRILLSPGKMYIVVETYTYLFLLMNVIYFAHYWLKYKLKTIQVFSDKRK